MLDEIASLAMRFQLRLLLAGADFGKHLPPSIDQPRIQLVVEGPRVRELDWSRG